MRTTNDTGGASTEKDQTEPTACKNFINFLTAHRCGGPPGFVPVCQMASSPLLGAKNECILHSLPPACSEQVDSSVHFCSIIFWSHKYLLYLCLFWFHLSTFHLFYTKGLSFTPVTLFTAVVCSRYVRGVTLCSVKTHLHAGDVSWIQPHTKITQGPSFSCQSCPGVSIQNTG